ncbi:MAG: ATP-binding protein [Pseudomonadota bacterium]|nr:ATP-binding protein [Pseudomonadota bacterium]
MSEASLDDSNTLGVVAALRTLVRDLAAANDEPGVLGVAVRGALALGIVDVAAWSTGGPEVWRVEAFGRLTDLEGPPRPHAVEALPDLDVRPCGAPGRRDGVLAAWITNDALAERFGLVIDLASAAFRRIERAREAGAAVSRLSAERHRTRALVEQSPLIVAIRMGPDHVLEMGNGRYHQMVGPSRDLYGRPGRETLPEVSAQGFFDRLDRVYATGEPFHGHEVRAQFDRLGDGNLTEGWFNYTWAPLRDAEGRIVGTAIHAVDVTEQVLARLEAEAARARFQDLVNSIDAIVWETEIDVPAFTFVSEWAERVLGYPRESWYEAGFWKSILHPDDVERVTATSRTALRRGWDHELEYRVLARDGRSVWMHDVVRVIRDDEGRPRRVRGVMLDVTARMEAERERDRVNAQLLHAQKLESLGLLASGVAHDFNNLLAVVLGNASLALVRAEDAGAPTNLLTDIVVAARRAQNLTRQLLAYAGKAPFRTERLDLSANVREILGLVEAGLKKKVVVETALGERLPPVQADPAQLQQVVMNLVMNAAEAAGELVGKVTVSTAPDELDAVRAAALGTEPGAYVVLEVVDSGPGMGPEVLARVFDPFFSTKGMGRGLGLSAVAGIVRAHGGAIRFESEPGVGTHCRVYLPAAEAREAEEGSTPEVRTMRPAEGTILVVDDEADVRSTARLLLEYLGYQVLEAGDGPTALGMLASDDPAIVGVLLDLTMPIMDGEETLALLRERHPHLPVVVSSGFDQTGAMGGVPPTGPTAFLQKPYTLQELAASLVAARSA